MPFPHLWKVQRGFLSHAVPVENDQTGSVNQSWPRSDTANQTAIRRLSAVGNDLLGYSFLTTHV